MGVFNFLWDFLNVPRGDRGQTMIEYALIIGIIAVGLIVVFVVFGENLRNIMDNIISNITGDRDDEIEKVDTPERGGGFKDYDYDE